MRVLSRVALVFIVLVSLSTAAVADHLQGDCPLTLVGTVAGGTDFGLSPHGVFRSNGNVYVLRGQTLSTYTANAAGELTLQSDDFISVLAGREDNGAVLVHNGFLYVSTNAGLEVFALSNLRAPVAVLRNVHYRRLAASGATLAGLYPGTDLPCAPNGTSFCSNYIEIINIADPANPTISSRISSQNLAVLPLGFNDIAFNYGYLYAAGDALTLGFNVGNQFAPQAIISITGRSTFLVSNGANLLGVGNDGSIEMYNVSTAGGISRFAIYNISRETIDRANPIAYHPQAFIDDQAGRLITMIDEIDPQTLKPARTFAFDVFDFSVPMWEGAYQRGYENISYISPDEVKYNPVAVGSQVLVLGELSGLQAYGACGVAAGRFEWDGVQGLNCNGSSLHGWVTGPQKLVNVEILIDSTSLGNASLAGPPRIDISSRNPVQTWRLDVNLDATTRGEHTLRAVATDAFGTRRQFAAQRIYFNGPGQNCSNRRRSTGR
ncbi:MAG: hypothetical protein JJE51_01040 [Thermoanaerobaculia bacterium]|nr:hypothetical protein [Thermoanaerobaculia bacterium]